jgi:hypothetical protein
MLGDFFQSLPIELQNLFISTDLESHKIEHIFDIFEVKKVCMGSSFFW